MAEPNERDWYRFQKWQEVRNSKDKKAASKGRKGVTYGEIVAADEPNMPIFIANEAGSH